MWRRRSQWCSEPDERSKMNEIKRRINDSCYNLELDILLFRGGPYFVRSGNIV